MVEKQRYLKAKEIFFEAVEKEGREREQYVAQACASDEGLRRDVERMLAGDHEANEEWEATLRAQVEEQLNTPQLTYATYPVGEMLGGRYLIQKQLGEGGIGAVYLAADTRVHSRPVVVKLLLATSSRNQYLVDKFKHEGESLARIHHPGVVSVIDLGMLPDGKPYLVMEFVEGRTLASEIQAGGMDFGRAAAFIRQIAQALTAAHCEGIVHRDLKPANVMIQNLSGGTEQARLIDFGIARITNPQSANATQGAITVGTPAYIAPEQLERGEASAASDIYSLGVIAYEMLTGERPFAVDTNSLSWPNDLIVQQRAGVSRKPKALRKDLPDAAQEEILKALSFNPEDRHERAYEFGEGVARALTRIELGEPTVIEARPVFQTVREFNFISEPTVREMDQALQSFEKLWSAATFTDRIRPVTLDFAKEERTWRARGLGAPQKKTQYAYPLGSHLCLAFGVKRDGYLMLLDEGPEGIVYCLCPSWFAPDTRLEARDFYLPQEGSAYESFKLSGKAGRERMIAIISDEPLGLDWLSSDREGEPARVLKPEDFDALLVRLSQLGDGRWTALATYFEVI